MQIRKLQLIFIFCLGGSVAGYSSTVVSITNNADRVELYWPSLVNQTYEILVSTNLVEGFTGSHQVQATPPENDWFIEMQENSVFYQLTDVEPTNIPSTSPTFSNLLANSAMESDISDWNFNASANIAQGNYSWSNGELFVDIING